MFDVPNNEVDQEKELQQQQLQSDRDKMPPPKKTAKKKRTLGLKPCLRKESIKKSNAGTNKQNLFLN